jgi:hypothetical protein
VTSPHRHCDPLARNDGIDTTPHSRDAKCARAVAKTLSLERKEGAGKAGCPMHPQPRVQSKKAHELITTGSPEQSDFPCAMVLTAYNALSPVTGSFATVACACYRRLDSSVGAPGPHALAVRDGVARLATPPASIASRPNVRDDGQRPSYRDGMAEATTISDFRKEIFLASGLDTQISLNPLTKLVFRRRRFRAVEGGRAR